MPFYHISPITACLPLEFFFGPRGPLIEHLISVHPSHPRQFLLLFLFLLLLLLLLLSCQPGRPVNPTNQNTPVIIKYK